VIGIFAVVHDGVVQDGAARIACSPTYEGYRVGDGFDDRGGVDLSWAGLEPSPARASRGCKNDRPMAITLIAIVRRDPIALVICKSPVKCCQNATLSFEQR
jgi:hypothetical protein